MPNPKSFSYAFAGFSTAFREQANLRFHLLAAILVVVASFIFSLSPLEWTLVVTAIFFVIFAELVNSSLEYATTAISQDFHPLIKKAKDVAAAAVLLSSIYSIIIALFIFIPKL